MKVFYCKSFLTDFFSKSRPISRQRKNLGRCEHSEALFSVFIFLNLFLFSGTTSGTTRSLQACISRKQPVFFPFLCKIIFQWGKNLALIFIWFLRKAVQLEVKWSKLRAWHLASPETLCYLSRAPLEERWSKGAGLTEGLKLYSI